MFKFLHFPEIRKKILFSFGIIFVFRLLAHIPIPGVDTTALKGFLSQNAFLGLFNIFSGGGFQQFSIVTLGLNPYINASIIIQLFTMMVPSLEELSKEGETGREKINMYTKFLTVPLAFLQAYGMYFLLSKQHAINTLNVLQLVILILTMSAGTMILVWIGDLITEYGVGNGISLLIFVGIVSSLPTSAAQLGTTAGVSNLMNLLIFLVLTLVVIAAVVLVNEGTRNIPLEYGRTGVKSQKVSNYLPIKINQAGVIPIIFAISVTLIPSLLSGPLQASTAVVLHNIGFFLARNFTSTSLSYNIFYFLMVVAFTFFYTFIQFNPEKIADDIKKRGGFIPGIRPGKYTTDYLKGIVTKITLTGALFLGLVAILPYLLQELLGIKTLAIGGTSLLIVVSVVLETVRQIQSMMVTRNYNSYLE